MSVGWLDVVVRIGLVSATALLFAIVSMTYLRMRNRKMLLITTGFGVFFVHALITLPELVSDAYQIILNEDMHLLIHTIALIFILLGIIKD